MRLLPYLAPSDVARAGIVVHFLEFDEAGDRVEVGTEGRGTLRNRMV